MIRAVRCNQPSFKTVEFKKGFNIVLAERTKEATNKDSRNGLGKSTLIDIIHFCLGASTDKNKGLRVPELYDWTFILDFNLKGKDVSASRNTRDFNRIFIEGDFSGWPIKPERDKSTHQYFYRVKDWTTLLGIMMFDLSQDYANETYTPTFRSLISFFIRRASNGGYLNPFKHYSQQKEWDIQVNNAFLLGLNWEFASRLQKLKDKEKTLNQLKEAANQGILQNIVGTMGELEALRIRLENEIEVSKKQLESFQVHPQYHKLEREANLLTTQIHKEANDNIIDRQLLSNYLESLENENISSIGEVANLYEEAGLIFPNEVKKQFNQVIEFHNTIITNRKAFLETEIQKLRQNTRHREEKINELTRKRAEIMKILSAHGALEEYTDLQTRHLELVNRLNDVKSKIDNLNRFEEGKSSLKIEKEELLMSARVDLKEREVQRDAILRFNRNSEYLYSAPGTLSVNISDAGYRFNINIERSNSQGISYMKVFCYDLMLIQTRANKIDMPGFLIHDSTIFDGVDERQIAKALQLAAQQANNLGFQYICTFNSDMIPWNELEEDFKLDDYVRARFTDTTEDGGLLGIRF